MLARKANNMNLDKIVSEFFSSTTRLRMNGSAICDFVEAAACHFSQQLLTVCKTSGSSSEFYVEPMLPHIGDLDMLMSVGFVIAVPEGYEVMEDDKMRELEAVDCRQLNAFKTRDCNYSGYTFLQYCGTFEYQDDRTGWIYYHVENTSEEKSNLFLFDYTVLDQIPDSNLKKVITDILKTIVESYAGSAENNFGDAMSDLIPNIRHIFTEHGPAMSNPISTLLATYVGKISSPDSSMDMVMCINHPQWPPQAAVWPARRRLYGWPDPATITSVVSGGCDIVNAVHPWCRDSEFMNKHMMRFSFSRAETVLLNSWSPDQQIVYHMLRFFMKETGLISDATGLSNYHIKTLCLWTCELKSFEWWTGQSLISVCRVLLRTLIEWIRQGECQQYFIVECNIFDCLLGLHMGHKIMKIESFMNRDNMLAQWFVDNYITICSTVYGIPLSGCAGLQDTVSAIVKWRRDSFWLLGLIEVAKAMDFTNSRIQYLRCDRPLPTSMICSGLLKYYSIGMLFQYIASKITLDDKIMFDKWIDVLNRSLQYISFRQKSDHNPVEPIAAAEKLVNEVSGNKNVNSALCALQYHLAKIVMQRTEEYNPSAEFLQEQLVTLLTDCVEEYRNKFGDETTQEFGIGGGNLLACCYGKLTDENSVQSNTMFTAILPCLISYDSGQNEKCLEYCHRITEIFHSHKTSFFSICHLMPLVTIKLLSSTLSAVIGLILLYNSSSIETADLIYTCTLVLLVKLDCQMKENYPVSALVSTLQQLKEEHFNRPLSRTIDQLFITLIYRKTMIYICKRRSLDKCNIRSSSEYTTLDNE